MKFQFPDTWNAALVEARGVLSNPYLFAWALFVVGFPIYVLENGLPQPASMLLTLMIPLVLSSWDRRMSPQGRSALRALFVFVLYAFLANLIWTLLTGRYSINLKDGFLLSPLFYIYNGLLFMTMIALHRRFGDLFLWVTTRAVLASVTLLVLSSLARRAAQGGLRSSLTFNEPNQLGFYALLCAAILLLCQKRAKLKTWVMALALVGCSYLALLSASKAALGSIAMLGVVVLLGRVRTTIVAGLVLLVLLFTSNPFSDAIDRAQERIENDSHLDFFEERGYDRIVNHPEYWFVGSGEGYYRRFAETTAIRSHELHSSMGTLFFCYGIVGMLPFLIFMFRVMRRTSWLTYLVVAPAFAYGMTHQGLRFSMMWVLLGVVMILREARYWDAVEARKAST